MIIEQKKTKQKIYMLNCTNILFTEKEMYLKIKIIYCRKAKTLKVLDT